MRNVRAQGMVLAAEAAITPGSGALSLPTRCPAEHVPPRLQARGRCYLPSASLAEPGFSEEPPKTRGRPTCRQCGACTGRIPRQGPVYQRRQPARDSASSAALPLPPDTRESPPHHPRLRHAQRDAPAKRGGKRGAHENGSSGR